MSEKIDNPQGVSQRWSCDTLGDGIKHVENTLKEEEAAILKQLQDTLYNYLSVDIYVYRFEVEAKATFLINNLNWHHFPKTSRIRDCWKPCFDPNTIKSCQELGEIDKSELAASALASSHNSYISDCLLFLYCAVIRLENALQVRLPWLMLSKRCRCISQSKGVEG